MTEKSKYYYEWDRNSTSSTVNPKMKMSKEELGLEEKHITKTGGLFPTGTRSMDAKPNTRKEKPVFTGVLNYFPDAILEIAKCSYIGQKQHNPNKPLSWDRSKQTSSYSKCNKLMNKHINYVNGALYNPLQHIYIIICLYCPFESPIKLNTVYYHTMFCLFSYHTAHGH